MIQTIAIKRSWRKDFLKDIWECLFVFPFMACIAGVMDMERKPQRKILAVELFVVIALISTYHAMISPFAFGTAQNTTNIYAFDSGSVAANHLFSMGAWKVRPAALLLSGSVFDFAAKDNKLDVPKYASVFADYHCAWLALVMLVVMLSLRQSLLINIGIFAGLMFTLIPSGSLYIYAWDLPAAFFITAAAILFSRKQIGLMALCITAGCFFKETVLVFGLMVFFAGRLAWWRRIGLFLLMGGIYFVGRKLMMTGLHVPLTQVLNDASNWQGFVAQSKYQMAQNWISVKSFAAGNPLLNGCGLVLAVVMLGWQRRFLPYTIPIALFTLAHAINTGIAENHHFIQILPIAMMILVERQTSTEKTVWQESPTVRWLNPLTIAVVSATVALVAWQYFHLMP